jgi:hypothetical protein
VSTLQPGARLGAPLALARTAAGRFRARIDRIENAGAAVLLCFGLALAAYGVQSIAWPVSLGRDGTSYLMYYRDMWNAHPAFPLLMLFRTPLAPLLIGAPLQLGGAILLEIVLGIMYAISVVAYALAAATYSRVGAVLVAAALLLDPGYGALFHQAASDSVFAFAVAVWALGAVRAVRRPTLTRYALLGVGILGPVLARPSSQILVLFAVVPLVAVGLRWRTRLAHAAVFAAATAAALAAWAGYNAVRYHEFVVARTASADVPFYRTFVLEHAVAPQNGPASRRLAKAVQHDLLPKYREHFTLQDFFAIASDRMWGDLVVLSDRRWGWNSDYATLRRVALEAIRRHPGLYAHDVASAVNVELSWPYLWPAPVRAKPAPPSTAPTAAPAQVQQSDPSDPGGILWWVASTPDGHIRSGGADGLVWTNPGGQAHYRWLNRSVQRLQSDLPNRSGSTRAATALNDLDRFYPRPWMWLLLGALLLVVRRPASMLAPAALAALGLTVVVATMLGMPPGLAYRVPVDPLFVLLPCAALTLPRHPRRIRLPFRAGS